MILSVATEKTTPLGIDPETVRLVTQYLNHYATPDLTKRQQQFNSFAEKLKIH